MHHVSPRDGEEAALEAWALAVRRLETDLANIETAEQDVATIRREQTDALQAYRTQATRLSEARTAAALTHPSIVPIHRADELGDFVFFVMGYVDGESVAQRVDEARDITRYLINLLVFLGLLGTFWGLATTVPAVVDTIRSLAPQEGETGLDVFGKLMGGLESQLGGMGTAFSSSLLGLAGSLVVGLLELFAGHGQNRFYRELEEWLSSITRIGLGPESEGGDQSAMVQVLDHMAGQMESLQVLYTQADVSRSVMEDRLGDLAQAVEGLSARLAIGNPEAEAQAAQTATQTAAQTEVLGRIAEGQERLIRALGVAENAVDAESRMRLRSIDVQLLRILEELSAGRQETVADLRQDLAALTAAIRQLSRGTVGRG